MKPLVTALKAMLGASVLVGCSTLGGLGQPEVTPYLAMRDGGTQADDYYQLGRYYQSRDRLRDAAAAYRRAIALDDRHAEAHNALGALHAASHSFADAFAELERAIAIDPKAANFRNNLGYALYLQGRAEEAMRHYEAAVALDPGNAGTWNNMSLALAQLGKPALADAAHACAMALAGGAAAARASASSGAAPAVARACSSTPHDTVVAAGAADADAHATNVANADDPPNAERADRPGTVASRSDRPAEFTMPIVTAEATSLDGAREVDVGLVLKPTLDDVALPLQPLSAPAAPELILALAQPIVPDSLALVLEPLVDAVEQPARLEPIGAVESLEVAVIGPTAIVAPLHTMSIEALAEFTPPTSALASDDAVVAALPRWTDIRVDAFAPVAAEPSPGEDTVPAHAMLERIEPSPPPLLASIDAVHLLRIEGEVAGPAFAMPSDRSGESTARAPAGATETVVFQLPDRATVNALAPHVYELRWSGMATFARPAGPQAAAPLGPSMLEVSNGNGVTGMARRVGNLLHQAGFPKSRLTNQKPYDQATTEVRFRPGHERAAASLSARLPGGPAIVPDANLRPGVAVRLVLGRDLPRDVALVGPGTTDAVVMQ